MTSGGGGKGHRFSGDTAGRALVSKNRRKVGAPSYRRTTHIYTSYTTCNVVNRRVSRERVHHYFTWGTSLEQLSTPPAKATVRGVIFLVFFWGGLKWARGCSRE